MRTSFDQGLDNSDSSLQQARRRKQAKRAKPSKSEDSALGVYMRAMADYPVFTPEQEQRNALALRQARGDRWVALLGYAPLVPAMRELLEARLELDSDCAAELAQLEIYAGQLRLRRSLANEQQFERACAELGRGLPELDPDSELAEQLFADVERVANNQREGLRLAVARMPGDSRPFRVYLSACRKAQRRVRKLTNEFVTANLRLVVNLARRMAHDRLPLQDVIQEGNIGLLKAVERFDPRRGFRFSTYASWWIRHAVSRAIHNKARQVRLPVHVHDVRQKLTRIRRSYLALHGSEPSVELLAEQAGVSIAKIQKVLRLETGPVVSLDAPDSRSDGRAVVELLEDEDSVEAESLLEAEELERGLKDALARLRPMEADILRLRFGLHETQPQTLRELGERYALSRERIRQLQERAVEQVRDELGRMGLL